MSEYDIVPRAELSVVTAEPVPVDRVRLDTESVTEQQQVSREVHKEQIELEDPTTTSADATRTTADLLCSPSTAEEESHD